MKWPRQRRPSARRPAPEPSTLLAADSSLDDTGLFRRAALDAAQPAQAGDIVLVPSAWSRGVATAALLLVVALVLLFTWGSVTRRSTVTGQVVPRDGLIRITAAHPGVVVERHALDGQTVRRGDVLFVVSGDRAGPDQLDYQRGIAAQVELRRRSLQDDLQRLDAHEAQEAAQLERRAESLLTEQGLLERQGQLHAARALSAQEAFERYQDLFRRGFVSRDVLLARETEWTEARARVHTHQRDRLALGRDLATARRELDSLRARSATQRAELQRAVMQARQDYAEIEARRRVVVSAPADGRLTLLQADIGQSVDPTRALAHLVPQASTLITRLYVPSRAAGFVRPGDEVLLRYDAFPYQKFGQHRGRVLTVSQAAVAAQELQGLSLAPAAATEPLFAVAVELPGQHILPGGAPLTAGMRVEADLLHETRRLYEWVLEPLMAARARMEGAGSSPGQPGGQPASPTVSPNVTPTVSPTVTPAAIPAVTAPPAAAPVGMPAAAPAPAPPAPTPPTTPAPAPVATS